MSILMSGMYVPIKISFLSDNILLVWLLPVFENRTEEEFKAAHPDAETIWKLRGQPEKETDDDVTKKKKIIYNIPYMFNTSQGPRFRFCLIHLMRCALEQYFSHENDVSSGRVKNPEFVAKVKEILKEDDRLVVVR